MTARKTEASRIGNFDSFLFATHTYVHRGITCFEVDAYLRLEEAVEVPEAALDPPVGRHLLEAHVHEHLAELGSHLRWRV